MSPPFSLPLRETSGPGEPCAVFAVFAVIAVVPECEQPGLRPNRLRKLTVCATGAPTEPRAAVLLAVRSPAHNAKKLLRVVVSYFIATIPLSGTIAATGRRDRALLIDIYRVPRSKRTG